MRKLIIAIKNRIKGSKSPSRKLTKAEKKVLIYKGVDKMVKEYGETFRMLGNT